MHRFCFSSSPLGGVPLCIARRRSYGQQNVGCDAHIAPPISFPHRLSQRPGRRGRRPLQFVPADDVGSSGRPRAASPTIRFRKRHTNGRADNIRPYISPYVLINGRAPTPKRRGRCLHRPANTVSAQVVPKAGTSRTPSPTIYSGKISKPPGGRGRPPLQFVFGNVIQKAGRIKVTFLSGEKTISN